jgi:hypothetical protein
LGMSPSSGWGDPGDRSCSAGVSERIGSDIALELVGLFHDRNTVGFRHIYSMWLSGGSAPLLDIYDRDSALRFGCRGLYPGEGLYSTGLPCRAMIAFLPGPRLITRLKELDNRENAGVTSLPVSG